MNSKGSKENTSSFACSRAPYSSDDQGPPLQRLRQIPRILAQQLRCVFHVFFLAHSWPRVLINAIENFAGLPIFAGATDNCENRLAQLSRNAGHPGRRFSFERLSIQTSLARNDNIDIFHFRFEADRL